MTWFEEFAKNLGILETDDNGFYTGRCKALYHISVEILLSDDEKITSLSNEEKEELIKEKFYKLFPYMI